MDMHRQTSCPSPRLVARVANLRRAPAVANRREGEATGATGPDKWQLLRALTECRAAFGLGDRSLLVLEALASFHPARQIDPRQPAIVFPSNAELILRARGMAPATLRRHLAALVTAGFIARRDSPNGKRYCRRGESGAGDQSFGFDLTPLALRADEILAGAALAARDKRAVQRCRAEITVSLRQIAQHVASALEQGLEPQLWQSFAARLGALSGRVSRSAALEALNDRRTRLAALLQEAEAAWGQALQSAQMSANDAQNEHHKQKAESEYSFEKVQEIVPQALVDGAEVPDDRNESGKTDEGRAETDRVEKQRSGPVAARTAQSPGLSLERLLRLCPDFAAYAVNGLSSWHEAARVAETVRSMLVIPATAWMRAIRGFGRDGATIVLGVILQRADAIRSPGAYLQALVAKAERGLFSLDQLLDGLMSPERSRP
ncbi:plasmid replication protein RepC [Rhizobium rhizosphaerae]|nr:plasmid replication protein RepC [Xaviernesmea rhizosphaerae]